MYAYGSSSEAMLKPRAKTDGVHVLDEQLKYILTVCPYPAAQK
jgi:hypothetical protein